MNHHIKAKRTRSPTKMRQNPQTPNLHPQPAALRNPVFKGEMKSANNIFAYFLQTTCRETNAYFGQYSSCFLSDFYFNSANGSEPVECRGWRLKRVGVTFLPQRSGWKRAATASTAIQTIKCPRRTSAARVWICTEVWISRSWENFYKTTTKWSKLLVSNRR